jgi:hypothetical protein
LASGFLKIVKKDCGDVRPKYRTYRTDRTNRAARIPLFFAVWVPVVVVFATAFGVGGDFVGLGSVWLNNVVDDDCSGAFV